MSHRNLGADQLEKSYLPALFIITRFFFANSLIFTLETFPKWKSRSLIPKIALPSRNSNIICFENFLNFLIVWPPVFCFPSLWALAARGLRPCCARVAAVRCAGCGSFFKKHRDPISPPQEIEVADSENRTPEARFRPLFLVFLDIPKKRFWPGGLRAPVE